MDTDAAVWEGASAATWRERWRVPEVRLLARTGSTNDVARLLAAAGAPAGAVVIADEQTAGRGRFGRRWIAPPGRALLMTVLLRPGRTPADRVPSVAPIRIGLAVANVIERVTGIATTLKWPNDVLVPGHGKVAGILCEAGTEPSDGAWVVAGIGINTGQHPAELHSEPPRSAASIRSVTGEPGDRRAIAANLLDALRPFDLRNLEPLLDHELDAYARRDALRGHTVDVDGRRGIVDGLDRDGALRLRTAAGVEIVRSGSVRLAEPPTATIRQNGTATDGHPQPESRA